MASDSMRPLLKPGDIALLRPVSRGEALDGAVVAVDTDGATLVHRVVEEHTSGDITTASLATGRRDPRRPRTSVLGVVYGIQGRRFSETVIRRSAALLAGAHFFRRKLITNH